MLNSPTTILCDQSNSAQLLCRILGLSLGHLSGRAMISALLATVVSAGAILLSTHRVFATSAERNPIVTDLWYLSTAIKLFADSTKFYPPAQTSGKAPRSWRVEILRRIDHGELRDKYNDDEPWNGPNNRRLIAQMPDEFISPDPPADYLRYLPPNRREGITRYVAIVDQSTLWPSNKPAKAGDNDGEKILLIEAPELEIFWSEPRDATLEEAVRLLGKPVQHATDHWFYVRAYALAGRRVAFANGHCACLPPLEADVARSLLTRSIDNSIDVHALTNNAAIAIVRYRDYVKWDRVVAVSVAGITGAAITGFMIRRRLIVIRKSPRPAS